MENRIYISGAISGNYDFMERFAKAQKELEGQGYSVINPALINSNMPKDTTYEEYMKMSLTMLDMADSIYILKGWEKSRGANLEYEYSKAVGKKIRFQEKELLYKKDIEERESASVEGKLVRNFSERNCGMDVMFYYCSNCGRRLQDNKNNRYCPRCGAKLNF